MFVINFELDGNDKNLKEEWKREVYMWFFICCF